MLPAEFQSIVTDSAALFRDLLLSDADCKLIPDLLTAQDIVLAFSRDVGRAMLRQFSEVRAKQAMDQRGPCSSCGQRMEALSNRSWTHETLLGPVQIVDPLAYCRACHESARPAEALLGTSKETWSLQVQEAIVDLAADESCQKAVEKLTRHHPGVEMERTAALRQLHHHGKLARAFIDAKLDAERSLGAAEGRTATAAELEVEFDASMIPVATYEPCPVPEGEDPPLTPIRKLPVRRKATRWEEVKAGLAQVPKSVAATGSAPARLYALRPTHALEESFRDLFGLACMLGWGPTTQVRGLADGAKHIRTRMEATFAVGDFRFILDRPHCKEHLTSAGTALELYTGEPAQEWAAGALETLEGGNASLIVATLEEAWILSGDTDAERNETLRLEAGYFERNQDAVSYSEYRDLGWSTASSEIESAHRHTVQARIKIAGAWWHPDHVDDILALRMLKANGWWAEYWASQRTRWRERAAKFERRPAAA